MNKCRCNQGVFFPIHEHGEWLKAYHEVIRQRMDPSNYPPSRKSV